MFHVKFPIRKGKEENESLHNLNCMLIKKKKKRKPSRGNTLIKTGKYFTQVNSEKN